MRKRGITARVGTDVTYANWLADSVEAVEQLGLSLPATIQVGTRHFLRHDRTTFLAEYVPDDDTIYLNPGVDAATRALRRDMAKLTKGYHEAGFFSTDHPAHTLIHEIGHREHLRTWPGMIMTYTWEDAADAVIDMNAVGSEVSEYATQGPLEFVAEVYAGRAVGRSYSAAIMKVFRQLRGVAP